MTVDEALAVVVEECGGPNPYAIRLQRAATVLAAEVRRHQWIPVSEQLPDCDPRPGSIGASVLVWLGEQRWGTPHARDAFYGRRVTDKPAFYLHGTVLDGVTHWMPLPAPPKEEA